MKRVLIGGFLSLIGAIWSLAIIIIAGNNLVLSWSTPPGRFLTTVMNLDFMPIFVLSIILTVLGVCIMVVEFFRKAQ